ncbi:efflux RND transporter periplasmic adaptor subunit [Marivirga sp.]|uniref:efflux RND transporter periplasmic adaptor subunit n=1 Tax=Marivirga sp. TaxID=2018662 RepID=UPI003DA71D94
MKTLNKTQQAIGNKEMLLRNAIGKWAIVYCLLLILATSCKQEDQSTNETYTDNDKTQRVEVVYPQQRSFTAEVSITGTALPNQIVTLFAMESGMLMQMRKDIGDRVTEGEVIARLENPKLYQQKVKWEAEAKAKKAQYERLNSIYEKTPALTNIQKVEDAEADYLSAKANLAAANNRIGFLTVKAPFSGIVTKRMVDKGAMIQSGLKAGNTQAIVEVQEINPIRLTIPAPETDAVGITEGMEATISIPELSGKTFNATVSRISNALDQQSKTMQVEIDLGNPDGSIISGMYAKALLEIKSSADILSLPQIAKISHKNEDYFLLVEDGKVKRLKLVKGLSNQDYFEVLNTEISAKSQVIVRGKSLVKPGQKVEAVLKNR